MEKGEKRTKGGKMPLGTFGKLRPERKKFTTKPQQIKDLLEKESV
jgi:30S ribosomal protein S31